MESINRVMSQLENGQYDDLENEIEKILENGSDEEKLVLAEELFNYGFIIEAQRLYKRLLENYPDEGELIVSLAETLIENGDEEKAILELEKVNESDPSYPQSMLLLADLYQMEGLYEVSEQKLLKAKNLLPNEIIIDFALGELYSEQGKFIQAINCYEIVLQEEDEIAGVNVNLKMADAISAGGAFEKALPYYEKALSNNTDLNTLFNYGFTALQAGYNKKAIELFLQLIEIDPEFYSVYINLAKAYEREEEVEKGYEILIDGIQYDEYNKDLFLYAGKMALKNGKEEEAEKMFREALALDPELTEAALMLNKLLLHQERYEDVIEIIKMMEDSHEVEPRFQWDAAIAYQNIENYSQALNKYESAYTFFKEKIDFLIDYGYFLIEEGKRDKAIEIINMIIKKDPNNEEFQDIWQRLTSDNI